MGEVINLKDILPLAKKESKESDLVMFAVLYFSEYFAKLYSDVDIEVRYALVISIYRYMADKDLDDCRDRYFQKQLFGKQRSMKREIIEGSY